MGLCLTGLRVGTMFDRIKGLVGLGLTGLRV